MSEKTLTPRVALSSVLPILQNSLPVLVYVLRLWLSSKPDVIQPKLSACLQNENMSFESTSSSASSNFVELTVSELNRMNIAFQDQNPEHYIYLSLEETKAGDKHIADGVEHWTEHLHTWKWRWWCHFTALYYTRVSQKFCNILVVHEAQFGSSGCFCQSNEGDKPHWTVKCPAHLIISEFYSFALPDFVLPLRSLQSEWNFLNLLVTVLWSSASLPFAQQMFYVSSFVLWSNLNS